MAPSTSIPLVAHNNGKLSPGQPLDPEAAKDVLLFQPSTIKSVTLKNRIVVAPMCMYSCEDGLLNDFHLAHYFSFALKGAGLIIIEASGVEAQGRISPHDAGIWSDDHIAPLKRVTDIIKSQGSVPGLQIAHAGRKASMASPFQGYRLVPEAEGGWDQDIRGPSDEPFDARHGQPRSLSKQEMQEIKQKFADAAVRADKAGVEVLEIHSAHG